MLDTDLKYLIALNHFPKFGPKRLTQLKKFFPKYFFAFKAGAHDLESAGINANIAQEFISWRNDIDIDNICENLEKENIKILEIDDNMYPKLLKEIYTPPPLLYYRGEIKKSIQIAIAVVGTRKNTVYGAEAVSKIVKDLVDNNIGIISGLALGIDTLAHQACLTAGGYTVAVLGTGIDKQSIYPSINRYLADKIIANGGMIITEFPIKTAPLKHHFPQRNRIISGLGMGTLVIEAGKKSGSLITANYALEQNREVFAVPGNIFSNVSEGSNYLIKQGAKAISSAKEIMEALDLSYINKYINNNVKILPDNNEEKSLISHLSREPMHVNELVRLSGLNVAKTNATLALMEMKGMVKNIGQMQYIKII